MTETAAGEAPRADLREHPAVRAWERLRPERARPTAVETLSTKSKSGIYRLTGAGPGGSAVIAKFCREPGALIERAVYEEVLPRLPLPALRYYGFVEEGGPWCWLFLGDAGREKYSPDSEAHRAVAARWLGHLHTSAAGLAGSAPLPDRGPGSYRGRLRSARQALGDGLGNPALPAGGPDLLRAVVAQLDTMEAGWQVLEECCARIPPTLVHGDFRRKNVRIRGGTDGIALFPIDWEMAGWGTPAADLALSRRGFPQVDLPVYWSLARRYWPGLDLEGVERLAQAGTVFQRLLAIHWECPRITTPWPQKAIEALKIYHAEIAQALQQLNHRAFDG
jgi:Phosphotransferase enzyme family